MDKIKDYNKDLRATILICSIREEETASKVLKNMLRLIKPDSKTLDNKSSSLSFKNKIDLLYDIDDINKDEYADFLKFMEIRNQFIHNPICNSFIILEKIDSKITNYLLKKFPNDFEDKEEKYLNSFNKLFMFTMGKLLVLNMEYNKGYTTEFRNYLDSQLIKNINIILKRAKEEWMKTKSKQPKQNILFFQQNIDLELEYKLFELCFKNAVIEESGNLVTKIENQEITSRDIFGRKQKLFEN